MNVIVTDLATARDLLAGEHMSGGRVRDELARQWREVEIALTGPQSATHTWMWTSSSISSTSPARPSPDRSSGTAVAPGGCVSPPPSRTAYGAGSLTGLSVVNPATGQLVAAPAEPGGHPAYEHGFVTVASQARAGRHADGSPWLLVADTAWAMPWRALWPMSRRTPRIGGQGLQRRPADDRPA